MSDRRQLTLYGGTILAIILATELGVLNRILDTTPLTGGQWLVCLLLAGGPHRGRGDRQARRRGAAAPDDGLTTEGRAMMPMKTALPTQPNPRTTDLADRGERGPARRARRIKFPTALTVLALVLLVVWLASFFIPSGRLPDSIPRPAARSRARYHELPDCSDAADGEPCVDKSLGRAVPPAVAGPAERPLRRGEHRDRSTSAPTRRASSTARPRSSSSSSPSARSSP